jgi:hypothetical protein
MKKIYVWLTLVLLCSFYNKSIAQYVTNGSTFSLGGTAFQITYASSQGGSVWYQVRLDLRYDFTINADLNLGTNNNLGGDGIAFVIQPISSALGSGGGGLGYESITPSLAVEFDTYQNTSDPAEDHIGFMENGNASHPGEGTPSNMQPQQYSTLPNIEDGQNHPASFNWSAAAHTLTVSFLGNTYVYTADIINTIFGGNTYVYWGFTAATGAVTNDQKVNIGTTSFVEELNLSGTPTATSCPSNKDGSLALKVTGGLAPYNITVNGTPHSGADGNLTLLDLAAGNYTVSVQDNAGVTKAASAPFVVVNTPDNTAPVPDVASLPTITGECSATVSTTPIATDICAGALKGTTTDPLTYTAQGTYIIHWAYNDGNGNNIVQTQTVIVKDVTPPVKPTLADVTSECSATTTAPATTDNCAGTVTGTTSDPLTYSTQGIHVITWSFNDGNGNITTAQQNLIVKDVTPPVISGYSVDPATLGPPNHKMKDVKVNYTIRDNCTGVVSTVLSVSSNEPVDGLGDGDTAPDWKIIDNHHVQLRAERAGNGTGRIYTITIKATDAAGNVSTQTVTVSVPLDQAKSVTTSTTTGSRIMDQEALSGLNVRVISNPTHSSFGLVVRSSSNKPLSVSIRDAVGRVLEVRSNIAANGTIQIGQNLHAGVYFAELIQGAQKIVVTLIKQ